jgi:hypothetical protein
MDNKSLDWDKFSGRFLNMSHKERVTSLWIEYIRVAALLSENQELQAFGFVQNIPTDCPEFKDDSVWFDELTEEPQKAYNKQPKRKAQWKREINPRKH